MLLFVKEYQKMSENVRVCQFFLRGRCKREKCQFRHPLEVAGAQNHAELSNNPRARSRSSDRRIVKSCSSDDAGMIDSSEDDEEEMKERQLFREEREKVPSSSLTRVQAMSNH